MPMRFFRWTFRFRWLIVILSVLATVFLGWQARHLEINADLTSYLPRTDPAVETLEHVADTFGGNFLAVVAIEGGDIFSPRALESLQDLTSRLQLLEGVNYVTSLTNVLDLKKSEEGLEIGKLLSEGDFPLNEEQAKALRDEVLSKKRYRNRIVSADGQMTLILVAIQKEANKNKVVAQIKETIAKGRLKEGVHLAGLPFQLHEISRYILRDLKTLTPLVALVVLLSLYFSFRHWRGVIIPLAAVAMSTIWTLGLMSLARVPLTIISDAIPVLLLAIGSAYSIHVINRFEEAASELKAEALAHVSTSVFLAAVTTVFGFLSFVFGSYLSAIREFGFFASVGVLFSLILATTFVPAWLFLASPGKPGFHGEKSHSALKEKEEESLLLHRWPKKGLGWLGGRKLILGLFLLLIVAALGGVPKIKRHSNMLDYFPVQSEIKRSEELLEKRVGGSIPIHILVRGDIQNPAVLREMKAMEEFLEQDPVVHSPISIADYLAEMNELMGEGEAIPDTREKVSNLLFLLEGQEGLDTLLAPEKTEAVIQALIPSLDVRGMKALIDRVEAWLRNRDDPVAEMKFSGSPLVYIHLDESLLRSQVLSLALAFGLIYLCVLLLVRSPRGAVLGLIPIGFTLVLVFGLMGYTGIPLDIATVLVGSVSVGIGIDYALHFFNRFRMEVQDEEQQPGSSPNVARAIDRTLRTTGRAILINMATVALGFLVLLLGNLVPLRRFGLLVAVTMLSSGCGALTLLPMIINRIGAEWLVTRNKKRKFKVSEEKDAET